MYSGLFLGRDRWGLSFMEVRLRLECSDCSKGHGMGGLSWLRCFFFRMKLSMVSLFLITSSYFLRSLNSSVIF
jgi:hypothetical protein